jgi:hypothetical protein
MELAAHRQRGYNVAPDEVCICLASAAEEAAQVSSVRGPTSGIC